MPRPLKFTFFISFRARVQVCCTWPPIPPIPHIHLGKQTIRLLFSLSLSLFALRGVPGLLASLDIWASGGLFKFFDLFVEGYFEQLLTVWLVFFFFFFSARLG